MKDLRKLINKELLFFDGSMGTLLQERGLKPGESPEMWNLTNRDEILNIHREYVLSGANITTTNTFGANPIKFEGNIDVLEDVIKEGILISKEANPKGYTALDIGPLGKLLEPFGDLSFDDAYNAFSEVVKIGSKYSPDLILIETMSDVYEAKAAVLAAKENSDLPVFLTFSIGDDGKLLTGADAKTIASIFNGLGVDVLGFNCGLGPKELLPIVEEFSNYSNLPIMVNPNAGLPEEIDGRTVFNISPEEFATYQTEIYKAGASILGGCCGTKPEHIKAMVLSLLGRKPKKLKENHYTTVSSYSKTVFLGGKPVIIGERINPTGKKLLKEALRNNDIDYLLREATAQIDAGADILDVNVGLPEIDEVSMMLLATKKIQGVSNLPLQIDTSNPDAMEKALRYYNGKPLVNSVNGEEESLNKVLPLVKKYGAAVVCLTLDENGIPETASGRIKIAKKIVDRAEKLGIPRENLIIDALALTVSTGKDNAKVTLDTIDYVKNVMCLNTVLGVSNISFGLPRRDIINSVFFANALERGLSAGIINPMSQAMMNTYHSFNALHGFDDDLKTYISSYTDTESKVEENKKITLKDAVVKGLSEDAYKITKELLKEKDALSIINEELVPSLDIVGDGFQSGKLFLPQLLTSADAAKRGFDAIKESMPNENTASKGNIIIATVKADIHDIGKNIAKVLLENYGYNVIDLGKDVSPEVILEKVKEHNVRLVGLSALMTTTVSYMEETIRLLKENTDAKIMVGGAVLTKDYAEKIGADFYAKDALSGVKIANEIFNN